MPLGLQYVPINQILDSFEELGINTIRFPFSNQMLHDTTPVQDAWVAANTQFRGMTPLQVYDGVIKALTDRGFAVIVNNHVTNSIWCCGVDGNERWNESQDINTWISDWLLVVNRYKDNKRVVGADLYNEVSRLKPITSIYSLTRRPLLRSAAISSPIPTGVLEITQIGRAPLRRRLTKYCKRTRTSWSSSKASIGSGSLSTTFHTAARPLYLLLASHTHCSFRTRCVPLQDAGRLEY
jgi:hypothetical protein